MSLQHLQFLAILQTDARADAPAGEQSFAFSSAKQSKYEKNRALRAHGTPSWTTKIRISPLTMQKVKASPK